MAPNAPWLMPTVVSTRMSSSEAAWPECRRVNSLLTSRVSTITGVSATAIVCTTYATGTASALA
jgi:hypothetical protein